MSTSAAVRASSLLVSAGLLGGFVVLALTFSIAMPDLRSPDPGTIVDMLREPEPPPPPVVRTQPNPPPITPIEDAGPAFQPLPTTPTVIVDPVGPISFGDPTPTIENPHWLQRPRDLQRYYPRRALNAGVQGMVVLNCTVATTGRLSCSVASENPTNWGFGDAALRIAADHRMEPATRDGVAVQGRYTMRVPFRTH